MYYKARTNTFPVLLCTTQLAQTTSQYHFVASFVVHSSTGKCLVLQSLHKVVPSTTVYYKACTRHFPVLLCTTKLATTTSQYRFVLQSLHKVVRSTTLYYKACTKSFPVLLCTTKLAQTTSQYYCVLQNLHKALSFPYRHCDIDAAKDCSFPYRHGDIHVAKNTRFCSFP